MWTRRRFIASAAAVAGAPVAAAEDGFERERTRMQREIDADLRATARDTGRDALSPAVRRAMQRVPVIVLFRPSCRRWRTPTTRCRSVPDKPFRSRSSWR